VGVVGGLGDVAVYAADLRDFARRFLALGRWSVGGAVVLDSKYTMLAVWNAAYTRCSA
jgi:hypothetical protein